MRDVKQFWSFRVFGTQGIQKLIHWNGLFVLVTRYDGVEFGHRAKAEESTDALYAATRHEGFNEVVRGRILAGNYFLLRAHLDKYLTQAQKLRRLITRDFQEVFSCECFHF